MTIEEVLKVLKDHQRWRLGDDEVEATNPKELTRAIEVAIVYLSMNSELRVLKVKENEYKHIKE